MRECGSFKVPNWNLKTRTGKAPEVSALCLYRERHSDVVERFAVRKGYLGQCQNHAGVYDDASGTRVDGSDAISA